MSVIGFDTSNYTTSIAWFDGKEGENCSQLLPVKPGALGLRQSDAVFHHTASLPELSDRLFSHVEINSIRAVGVSIRPRSVEGSYMPCFSVGYSHARLLSNALHVPLYTFSHQEGHVASAVWSAGRMDLMDVPHLAWHLSGGTTELLHVQPQGSGVHCERIGGSSDISAGQLIDRTGLLLGLPFPAGRYIDDLSKHASDDHLFRVRCEGTVFSLSGVQNKVQEYWERSKSSQETAGYVLRCVCEAVKQATENALKSYPGLPVVFSGGVASNELLRREMGQFDPVFALPEYSRDNAIGVAVLTNRRMEGESNYE